MTLGGALWGRSLAPTQAPRQKLGMRDNGAGDRPTTRINSVLVARPLIGAPVPQHGKPPQGVRVPV